ncbi:hypothetical protein Ancab_015398 [Ancistrocladus abbreviatus]
MADEVCKQYCEGLFHINGNAAYYGFICLPIQFQAYVAASLGHCYMKSRRAKTGQMSATSYVNGVGSSIQGLRPNGQHQQQHPGMSKSQQQSFCFQMPLHYPRYSKRDYETMPEWKLDRLLMEYGLPAGGDVEQKRKFAMGAFLWPSQIE